MPHRVAAAAQEPHPAALRLHRQSEDELQRTRGLESSMREEAVKACALTKCAEEYETKKRVTIVGLARTKNAPTHPKLHQHLRHEGRSTNVLPCEGRCHPVCLGALHKHFSARGASERINFEHRRQGCHRARYPATDQPHPMGAIIEESLIVEPLEPTMGLDSGSVFT